MSITRADPDGDASAEKQCTGTVTANTMAGTETKVLKISPSAMRKHRAPRQPPNGRETRSDMDTNQGLARFQNAMLVEGIPSKCLWSLISWDFCA